MNSYSDCFTVKNGIQMGRNNRPKNHSKKAYNPIKNAVLYPVDKLVIFWALKGIDWITRFFTLFFNLIFLSNRLLRNRLRKSKAKKTARFFNNIYTPYLDTPVFFHLFLSDKVGVCLGMFHR